MSCPRICPRRNRFCAEPTIAERLTAGSVRDLALVVGLQGRFAEAESIVKADLPADEAEANVAYLRQMLSRDGRRKKPPP
jgi:hypothetical protein